MKNIERPVPTIVMRNSWSRPIRRHTREAPRARPPRRASSSAHEAQEVDHEERLAAHQCASLYWCQSMSKSNRKNNSEGQSRMVINTERMNLCRMMARCAKEDNCTRAVLESFEPQRLPDDPTLTKPAHLRCRPDELSHPHPVHLRNAHQEETLQGAPLERCRVVVELH